MILKDEGCFCTVCAGTELSHIINIEDLPAQCNILWRDRSKALDAPLGNLELTFCGTCGHIFNRAFEQELVDYNDLYENALDFSPRFQSYAESLALYLIERYDLRNKDIIDIGCGKGEFLKSLVRLGHNRGVGFDPSYESVNGDEDIADQVTFIKEIYSQAHSSYSADLICSRHVLEHIEKPRPFIAMVREAIGDNLNTALYFEVPNALYTFRELGIWDFIYEHPSFFPSTSLAYLFETSGFENVEVTPRFGDQFLGLEAAPGADGTNSPEFEKDVAQVASFVNDFSHRYQSKINLWRMRLGKINEVSQKAVVWGAGSKGVTFLNLLKENAEIEFIVDINPRKQGMFVPGTGEAIISPEQLKRYKPDHIILMNSIYEEEIRKMVENLGISPQFWNA